MPALTMVSTRERRVVPRRSASAFTADHVSGRSRTPTNCQESGKRWRRVRVGTCFSLALAGPAWNFSDGRDRATLRFPSKVEAGRGFYSKLPQALPLYREALESVKRFSARCDGSNGCESGSDGSNSVMRRDAHACPCGGTETLQRRSQRSRKRFPLGEVRFFT